MRLLRLSLLSLACCAAFSRIAFAQGDPCYPPPVGLFGPLLSTAQMQQRQQACIDERKVQWDDYNAKQRAQQDAAERQKSEEALEQARAAATAAEAERERENAEKSAAYAAYQKQMEAEVDPNNLCKRSDTARLLIEEWNNFDVSKEQGIKVVDIEHLTTRSFSDDGTLFSCHGVFVTTRGDRLIGTLSSRKNVAGDPIFSWTPDISQNPNQYDEPPRPEPAAPANESSGQGESSSFAEGLSDRKALENWFSTLSGKERDGALWWASNRSLPNHSNCESAPDAGDVAWLAACQKTKIMVAPFDKKRHADAEYRKGWNSL